MPKLQYRIQQRFDAIVNIIICVLLMHRIGTISPQTDGCGWRRKAQLKSARLTL